MIFFVQVVKEYFVNNEKQGWDWGLVFLICGLWWLINFEIYEMRFVDFSFDSIIFENFKLVGIKVIVEVEGLGGKVKFEFLFDGE